MLLAERNVELYGEATERQREPVVDIARATIASSEKTKGPFKKIPLDMNSRRSEKRGATDCLRCDDGSMAVRCTVLTAAPRPIGSSFPLSRRVFFARSRIKKALIT